jgi:hypothetical protein
MDSSTPRRSDGHCPACNEILSANEREVSKCRCGAVLIAIDGIKGTHESESLLRIHGFRYESDARGDEYYVGPAGHIIHLYADGSWDSDRAPTGWSLGEYLNWVRKLDPTSPK